MSASVTQHTSPWMTHKVTRAQGYFTHDTSNLHNAKVPRYQCEVILTGNLSTTGFLFAGSRLKLISHI